MADLLARQYRGTEKFHGTTRGTLAVSRRDMSSFSTLRRSSHLCGEHERCGRGWQAAA